VRNKQRSVPVWLIAIGLLVLVALYALGGAGLVGTALDGGESGSTAAVADTAGGADVNNNGDEPPASTTLSNEIDYRFSTLDPIDVGELPPEAVDTLNLVFDGGPFPFDRDDTVFQNREGLLPDHDRGYYREYTVITPGESDRGARRIVAGADGDLYYTHDHYRSFREIVGIDW